MHSQSYVREQNEKHGGNAFADIKYTLESWNQYTV